MDWFSNMIWLGLGATNLRGGAANYYAVLVTNAGGWSKPLTETPILTDITANLCTASGYAEKQLTTPVWANDYANQRVTLTFTIPSFGANVAIGQTIAACVVYYKGTLESTIVDPLMFVIEGTDKATTGGSFTVTVPTPPAYISAIRNS